MRMRLETMILKRNKLIADKVCINHFEISLSVVKYPQTPFFSFLFPSLSLQASCPFETISRHLTFCSPRGFSILIDQSSHLARQPTVVCWHPRHMGVTYLHTRPPEQSPFTNAEVIPAS